MAMVKLGDVAIEKRETWTGSTQGVPIIGLEHLVPGEITLSSWDSDTDNTFSKMFRKDQVLLGRRRVYLKKAVIAPFDGICSGDITVIEAIPGKISPRLLPFIIQNERFFDYAIQGSAGSLSPRVKWEHLKDYEFNLSDYEEQESLANKLWSALKLKESYHALLLATDEMVKSRFVEQFGSNKKTLPLSEWIGTSFPGEWGADDIDGTGVKVIRTTNFTNTGKLDLTNVVTRDIETGKVQKKRLKPGDIILERSGGTADNPVGRVVYFEAEGIYLFNSFTQLLRCKDGVNSLYVFYSLFNYYQTHKNEIRSMGNKTTGIQNLKMDKYWEIPIVDASSESQEEFVSLYRQADKSKFSDFKSRFIAHFLGSSYTKKRLGDVCSVFSGKTVDLTKENEGGPIAYLKVADLSLPENDRVITTSSRFVSEQTAKASGLVPIGATIFPKNGAAALHNKKRITSVITCVDMNTMAVYSTSDTVMPEYLYG